MADPIKEALAKGHKLVGWTKNGRPIFEARCFAVGDPRSHYVNGYPPIMGGSSIAPYSSTNDGYIQSSDATYATARAGSTLSAVTNTNLDVGQALISSTYYIWRSVMFFDTSLIPSGATIDAAVLSVFVQTDGALVDFDVTVVSSTSASPPTTGDWANFGSTSGGSVNTSGISGVAYTDITLNSTGRDYITKGGTTKLGLRSSRDISATAPSSNEYIRFYGADNAGTDKDPYLTVTYTPPVVTGSGTATGTGTLTGTAAVTHYATGTATGTGTAEGITNVVPGVGTATGTGTLTATAKKSYKAIHVEQATSNLFTSALSQSFSSAWTSPALNGTYTVSIQGPSGSLALTGGATATVNAGTPVTITVSSATVTFTPTGTPTYCQLEAGSFATSWQIGGTARVADSLNYLLGVPLTTRHFDCVWWVPDQASTVIGRTAQVMAAYTTDASPVQRYSVEYSSGQFRFKKYDGSTWYECASGAYSYAAGDVLFLGWLDDPTSNLMRLYIGKNGAAITTYDLVNAVAITDAKKIYLGCASSAGTEANGLFSDLQSYDIATMAANNDAFDATFVDAIYTNDLTQEWGYYTQLHATLASAVTCDTDRLAIWISPTQDASTSTDTSTLTVSWTETIPAGTAITLQVATSTDGTTWSAWTDQVNGSTATAPARAYSKVRAILEEIGDVASPTLSSVTCNYDGTPMATTLLTGLSAAVHYSFAQLGDYLLIFNGVDLPHAYNGTIIADIAGAPRDKVCCVYKNCVFSASGSTLSFSDLLDHTTWPAANYIDVNPSDGDEIMALVPTSVMLLIVKRHSLHYLQGSGPSNFSVAPAGEGGTISHYGFIQTPYGLFCVDYGGIWATDLVKRATLTDNIEEDFNALNSRRLDKAALYMYGNKLLLAATSGGGSANDTVYAYDLSKELRCWVGKWTGWNPAMFLEFKEGCEVKHLFASSLVGQVYEIGGADDDAGTAFTVTTETGHLPLISGTYEKRLLWLESTFKSGTASTSVGISFVTDGATDTERTFTLGTGLDCAPYTSYPTPDARTVGIKTRFIGTTSAGPTLLSHALTYYPIGVRAKDVT